MMFCISVVLLHSLCPECGASRAVCVCVRVCVCVFVCVPFLGIHSGTCFGYR